ncbi:hypothetical protein AWC38_SpisGene25901 [Stylophora pistillata]|uniref:Uncharacterized protein n=1 Tax=Stylophora pistillata TaxID=50429 RepID=A0A2B4SYE7_STYPI|nr:hypothetical protein AWC38_SpisGene25901 [Stylophora pistillata]
MRSAIIFEKKIIAQFSHKVESPRCKVSDTYAIQKGVQTSWKNEVMIYEVKFALNLLVEKKRSAHRSLTSIRIWIDVNIRWDGVRERSNYPCFVFAFVFLYFL